jgi:hypothetical protein
MRHSAEGVVSIVDSDIVVVLGLVVSCVQSWRVLLRWLSLLLFLPRLRLFILPFLRKNFVLIR